MARVDLSLALWIPSVLAAVLLVTGCAPIRDNEALAGKRNDPCAADIVCGPGLVCASDGTCQDVGEPGTFDSGEACLEQEDCRFGFVCNGNGICGNATVNQEGEACLSDRACADGLVCANNGACAEDGDPGTTPAEGACEADADCAFGLVCGPEQFCIAAPRWAGVDCEGSVLPGPPRVLFDVPRGDALSEFYRLPFPNDVRARAGSLDLSGFPGADVAPEPGDMLGRYLAAVREGGGAFSPNSAIVFRFSQPVDFTTLDFGGEAPNFTFVDITPDSDSRGRSPRSRFYATGGRDRYICPNWLGIRPSEGTPLTYGHTYAVLFRRGLTNDDGVPLEPSEDLSAVLGDVPPIHPALATAWQRYAPLRSWLAEEEIPAEDVIGASVVTVGDPRTRLASVRQAVLDAPSPGVSDVVVCGEGPSPCADSGLACTGGDGVIEIHARLELPGFLQGVPPYADWGGDAVFQDGQPRVQRVERVCAAMTVPRGAAPDGGWPVALFAHDLGGSAATAIDTGLAADLAESGWATLSYDGVLHGARYGAGGPPDLATVAAALDEPARPGLFRDQALQGAADLFALVRLLQAGVDLPTGAALSPDRVAFIGHGRGGQYGVPFAAYEPGVEAAVFAAVGGDMVDWMQKRTAPRNVAAELIQAFAERAFNGMHPALHLIQTWLDARDPVHFGTLIRRPPEGVTGKHVLFVYGPGDTITAPTTMNHLAIAMRLAQIGDGPDELTAVQRVRDPDGNPLPTARGNVSIGGSAFTQVIKQYVSGEGADAHLTLFEHPRARSDVQTFFQGLLENEDGVPVVSEN